MNSPFKYRFFLVEATVQIAVDMNIERCLDSQLYFRVGLNNFEYGMSRVLYIRDYTYVARIYIGTFVDSEVTKLGHVNSFSFYFHIYLKNIATYHNLFRGNSEISRYINFPDSLEDDCINTVETYAEDS